MIEASGVLASYQIRYQIMLDVSVSPKRYWLAASVPFKPWICSRSALYYLKLSQEDKNHRSSKNWWYCFHRGSFSISPVPSFYSDICCFEACTQTIQITTTVPSAKSSCLIRQQLEEKRYRCRIPVVSAYLPYRKTVRLQKFPQHTVAQQIRAAR